MLPLKLSVEGLYSYQSKQTIDFEELTDAGLFGIFGAVGSGKSTILEAIGFVLFGNTERMNSQEKRSYNMLNLKSCKASIDFEFLNFENEKYKFTADWSRKKKFEDITPIERKAYKWIGSEWIPLESVDGTPIVGLSYDNFKRTIIIPQGKFKEFLELGGKARSEMMKEIFHLERFDLSNKVGSLKKVTEASLNFIKGGLNGFEEISQEVLDLKKLEIENQSVILESKKVQKDVLISEVQVLNKLKEEIELIEKRKVILSNLTDLKPEMDKLDTEIQLIEKVEKQFKTSLDSLLTTKNDLTKSKIQKQQIEELKVDLETKLTQINTSLANLVEASKSLPENKNKVTDYQSIIKIQEIQTEINQYEIQLKDALENTKKTELLELNFKNDLEKIRSELVLLKENKLDSNTLLELEKWYSNQDLFQLKITSLVDAVSKVKEEIQLNNLHFSKLELEKVNWRNQLDTLKIQNDKEKSEIETEKTKRLVSQQLSHFSSNLHDNENCPLCGSLEHPSIMKAEDVSEKIAQLNEKLKILDEREKEILRRDSSAVQIETNLIKLNKELESLIVLKTNVDQEFKIHSTRFIWEGFKADDKSIFELKKSEFKNTEKEITEKEKELFTVQTKLNDCANNLKSIREKNAEMAIFKASKEGLKANELTQLKIFKYEDFISLSKEQLTNNKNSLNDINLKLEANLFEKTEKKVILENQLASNAGSLNELKKQVEILEEKWIELDTKIKELLILNEYSSLLEVEQILNYTLDIETEKEKCKNYQIELQTAKNVLDQSIIQLNGQTFNSEAYTLKTEELAIQVSIFESLFTEQAKRIGELENLLIEFDKKAELLKEYEKVITRFENLKTLDTLFSGNGFVNYVSSIYLQNLAESANVRFHRITKNKLSLKINTSNEFEVIDYLNNGASRSVKTLSGGQGFQASLCLALSLAESVQSSNMSSKNFFFIDEGFGTQDAESVALVYETLQSLMKENRIVGFISHLTELQERIPRSITILKDDETGSYVDEKG